MENYITLSLETHLFFARIMKEHALFLKAGFPCINQTWIEQADYFRQEFEHLLQNTVNISNGQVNPPILNSGELTTTFTVSAEQRTHYLTGIPIDSEITKLEQMLRSGFDQTEHDWLLNMVHQLNRHSLHLLRGLIEFKENILKEVSNGRLFTANYPLLIRHIIREAKLYQMTIEELTSDRTPSYDSLKSIEEFWNRIMMEHALFIRGLLDPSEGKLIQTANQFAMDYKKLLIEAYHKENLLQTTDTTLAKTIQYRDFKANGTMGILNCQIASLILPLLADHVLREANHYIRLLETTKS